MVGRRSWVRVWVVVGGLLLVLGGLTWRYLPAVLVYWKLQEVTSKPGRMKALQAVPVAWEPVKPSGKRMSIGFATLVLGNASEYKAEVVRNAMVVLRSSSSTIMFLPPFGTGGNCAAESPEFRLRIAEANQTARSLGELLDLSKSELPAYLSVASMKARYPMFENGCATLQTPSISALVLLGNEGEPEKIHVTLYSKTNSQAVGVYVTGLEAVSAQAIALELMSGFGFEEAMDDEQTKARMVEAVKAWPGSTNRP